MPRDRQERRNASSSRATVILAKINSDIRSLNSSILIISQKMRYLVRNEKILGRNLLVLNKKLKEFESSGVTGGNGSAISGNFKDELARINETLANAFGEFAEIRSKVDQISQTFARQEDLKEIKFVVDALDPLQFVTRKDVEEIVRREINSSRKK